MGAGIRFVDGFLTRGTLSSWWGCFLFPLSWLLIYQGGYQYGCLAHLPVGGHSLGSLREYLIE